MVQVLMGESYAMQATMSDRENFLNKQKVETYFSEPYQKIT